MKEKIIIKWQKLKKRKKILVWKINAQNVVENWLQENGKYGAFLGCSNFPKCKYTEKIEKQNI